MTHTRPMIIVAVLAAIAAMPALPADSTAAAAGAPLISKKAQGEIAIVPEALMSGKLMFKVVAVNRTSRPVHFGPQDIRVFTASGKTVPLMSLQALIARVRNSGRSGSVTYDASGMGGPTVTRNMSGQPDLGNFAGGDMSSGMVSMQGSHSGSDSPAVKRRIAGLRSAILQDALIGPGELKGGEVVTQPIRFGWHEKHAFRVDIELNGENHEFTFAAPAPR